MIIVLEICLGFMCLDDHEACRSCWRWTLMSAEAGVGERDECVCLVLVYFDVCVCCAR